MAALSVMLAAVGEQTPHNNAPDEVAGIVWRTLDDVASDPECPSWTLQSLRRAAAVRAHGPRHTELRDLM